MKSVSLPVFVFISGALFKISGAYFEDVIDDTDDIYDSNDGGKPLLKVHDNEEFNTSVKVVAVTSADLESILTSKKPITSSHGNFLFEFKNLLIKFRWDDTKTNNVLKLATEYNKINIDKNFQNSVHLWLSFQPRKDIQDDINFIVDAVKKANSIYPGTVSAVVLNYGFLQLDHKSLPLINFEIEKVHKAIKNLPGGNVTFGLQLDAKNCRRHEELIKKLHLRLVDVVLFTSTEDGISVEGEYEILLVLFQYTPCLKVVLSKSLPVIDIHMPVTINFTKGIYDYDRHMTERVIADINDSGQVTKPLPVLLSAMVNLRKSSAYELAKMTEEQLISWLHEPAEFSKQHFGAVVTVEQSDQDAKRLFANFQKFFVKIGGNSWDEIENLKKLVTLSNFTSNNNNNNYHRENDKTTLVQTNLLVNIDKNDFQVNKKKIEKAISAAEAANQRVPGAVTKILVDFMQCSVVEACSGYNNHHNTKTHCSFGKMHVEMLNLLEHVRKNVKHTSTVHLGLVMDIGIFNKIFETATGRCDTKLSEISTKSVDNVPLACKITVREEEVLLNGATKVFNLVTEDLTLCTNFFLREETTVPLYYVKLVGCNGTYSQTADLTEFVRFYERLNAWATVKNKMVYVDAIVENPLECEKSKQLNNNNSLASDCQCGWWVATNAAQSDKMPSVVIRDKKSLALEFYDYKYRNWIRNESFSHEKRIVPATGYALLWWLLSAMLIIAIIVIVIATVLIRRYQSKYLLTKQEMADFLQGRLQKSSRRSMKSTSGGNEFAHSEPYNKNKYEISASSFLIDSFTLLGSGEFGKVFHGSINRNGAIKNAAVKMLNVRNTGKSHGGRVAINGLLSEIKILSYLGQHNHIVSLLGAYTVNLRKGDIVIFLELCELGSLRKYLRFIKPQIGDKGTENVDELGIPMIEMSMEGSNAAGIKQNQLDRALSSELCRYAGEIACGMEFLASKKVVHADLATRNVLLTNEKVAKISDFGLSRRMYDYSEYVKQSQAPLPWRWMAPESLRKMVFTEKSDVWAYGVTLWEIFSLGDEPYSGMAWNINFLSLLEGGLRLPAPKYNVREIYRVMQRCWNIDTLGRPTFAVLNLELSEMSEDEVE